MAKPKALLAHSANVIKVDFKANRRHGMSRADRFWDQVDKSQPNACWPYIGSNSKNGYGCFADVNPITGKKRNSRAHRVAYELANGPIPKGVRILHTCNNKTCCNPGHHYEGSQQQNIDDAKAAGQTFTRRLNRTKAREIVLLSNQKVRQVDIGARYGVSVQTINMVVNGRSYGAFTQDLRAQKPVKRYTAKPRNHEVGAVA